MVTVGLLVRLVAKPGREAEVAGFLEGGPSLVEVAAALMAQAPELLAAIPGDRAGRRPRGQAAPLGQETVKGSRARAA
jgi:hypothetical protein